MPVHHHPRRPRLDQHGATLIEVLVAALLLAIGLLAMIGIQATAVRLSKDAQSRNVATELANSFAEQIRANQAGALAGAYVYTVPYAPLNGPVPPAAPACDTAVPCTGAQVAAVDLARWRESVRQSLPGGGLIATLNNPAAVTQAPVMDLWVLWLEPQGDDPGDAATAQLNTNCPAQMGNPNPRPQCMLFRIQL